MTNARYDVLAIGNALVDVIADAGPDFIAERGLMAGTMRLIDAHEATALYAAMGPGREVSGGSAANTAAGVAAMGGRPAFVGRVADDQLGEVFAHDIRAAGVAYGVAPLTGGAPTGRCLVLVTPGGERTMNTFLGAAQALTATEIDAAPVADAAVLYLEGYLWDVPNAREAMRAAIATAKAAGRKVALSLSDVFVVDGHRGDFRALVNGELDLLFANENELLALFQTTDLDAAMAAIAGTRCVAAVTRSAAGAVILEGTARHVVPAAPVAAVVDTTGAGDLFAAGFLAGLAAGRSLPDCARQGAVAAAEVISHYGARPEADLNVLVTAGLG